MTRFPILVLACCCCLETSAHVVKSAPHTASSSPSLRASARTEQYEPTKLSQLQTGEQTVGIAAEEASPIPKKSCAIMLGILIFFCCCGEVFKKMVGEQAGNSINLFFNCGMFIFLLMSGTYSAWWHGHSVGTACKIMCWWVLFMMVIHGTLLCCLCCGVMTMVAASVVIKNATIKQMKEEMDKKEKDLSGPRKDYYNSDLFKQNCDSTFDKADVDGNGTLDMHELEDIVVLMMGKEFRNANPSADLPEEAQEQMKQTAKILAMAFDDNRNSTVEKGEFQEMMKFLSVMQLQAGKFTLSQSFEVLLLPEEGTTYSDVNKAYRKMAIKYHPDKRRDEAKEIVDRDMSEINDAKAVLEKHFKATEAEAAPVVMASN